MANMSMGEKALATGKSHTVTADQRCRQAARTGAGDGRDLRDQRKTLVSFGLFWFSLRPSPASFVRKVNQLSLPNMSTQQPSTAAASRSRFLSVFPLIREELLAYMDLEKMPQDARDWFRKVSSTISLSLLDYYADTGLAVPRPQHTRR